jgi:N6-L-threonylcarbamoyladenine synthase
LNFAKGFASAHRKPIIGVNHFLGHIYGVFLDLEEDIFARKDLFPMAALVVSGGHTALVIIDSDGAVKLVGTTLDDAAGEAFDKAAKMLDLGYPGGPVIEKASKLGDPGKYHFPRSLTGAAGRALDPANRFHFSFSGVKTAMLYHVHSLCDELKTERLEGQPLYDTLASYQEAIVDVLCSKAADAAKYYGAKSLILCGGVACNGALRERFETAAPKQIKVFLAPRKYCTDNVALIAGVPYRYYRAGLLSDLSMDAYARFSGDLRIPME